MPITSRAFVKASTLYLCFGAVLGALMFLHRYVALGPWVGFLRASHIVMLVVGWLTQLIVGVAWWLFPPLKIGLRSDSPLPIRRGQSQRGSEPLFWATFVCLNAGILLRAICEPLYSWTKISLLGFFVGISGLLLLGAAISFVVNMWSRVRQLGRTR
jgi:hypothetical protein